LAVIIPDLRWAHDLLAERERERQGAQVVLASLLMLGSGLR
jgi:hypothetical protein